MVQHELFRTNAAFHMLTAFATEAVVVFFILSGLVITLSTRKNRPATKLSPPGFLWRRLVRLYPIYVVALLCALGAQWTLGWDIGDWRFWLGNAFFQQSLAGHVVQPPSSNQALWSLSYEMTYYLLFAVVLAWRPFRFIWLLSAIGCAVLVTIRPISGPIGHLVAILSLAIPWLMGSAIAQHADRLPRCSVPLGLCFFAIALMFARSPLSSNFYDPFRLSSFALLCCPLLLAIVQQTGSREINAPSLPIAVFALGAALLWTLSPALLLTKIVITGIGLAAAIVPLPMLARMLAVLQPLHKTLVYIGTISYALYAVHLPILLVIKQLIPDVALLRLGVFLLVLLPFSHMLERVVQPRISRALVRRR